MSLLYWSDFWGSLQYPKMWLVTHSTLEFQYKYLIFSSNQNNGRFSGSNRITYLIKNYSFFVFYESSVYCLYTEIQLLGF